MNNINKYKSELGYWMSKYREEGNKLSNDHYQKLMCSIAAKNLGDFKNHIIADFGCGPRGSLAWAQMASIRIGIDVLADLYINNFYKEIIKHNMLYIKSTEKFIPIPSEYCDTVFTVNSLDHAVYPYQMLAQLDRILKKDGFFFGSFNLNEPPTDCEPNTLRLRNLLNFFETNKYEFSYVLTDRHPTSAYNNFYLGNYKDRSEEDKLEIVWIRATKR